MKFNSFPKKQSLYLIFSDYKSFKSDFFQELIIQVSPKNSIFFRMLNSRLAYLIKRICSSDMEVPNSNASYVGIVKDDRKILFELSKQEPIKVWRSTNYSDWNVEPFLGRQLIGAYTINEFKFKRTYIHRMLNDHWNKFNKVVDVVHGDLTHFNVLINKDDSLIFIDNKAHLNSRLYDLFYFYSYLNQCLSRCKTLSKEDRKSIVNDLESIITSVCAYSSKESLDNDFNAIEIPKVCGLKDAFKEKSLFDFYSFMSKGLHKNREK